MAQCKFITRQKWAFLSVFQREGWPSWHLREFSEVYSTNAVSSNEYVCLGRGKGGCGIRGRRRKTEGEQDRDVDVR